MTLLAVADEVIEKRDCLAAVAHSRFWHSTAMPGSHQICPLLKVDLTCQRATVRAHIDPEPTYEQGPRHPTHGHFSSRYVFVALLKSLEFLPKAPDFCSCSGHGYNCARRRSEGCNAWNPLSLYTAPSPTKRRGGDLRETSADCSPINSTTSGMRGGVGIRYRQRKQFRNMDGVG